jgi:hypothetical protein
MSNFEEANLQAYNDSQAAGQNIFDETDPF